MKHHNQTHLYGWFFLLLVVVIGFGWRMAGKIDSKSLPSVSSRIGPRSQGPDSSALCGLPWAGRPPPGIESPFGIHLYASTRAAKRIVLLPSIQIVDQLAPPEKPTALVKPGRTPKEVTGDKKNESLDDDVRSVTTILEEFRRAFGAMPAGEFNDEIVRVLQGENPMGIAVLPKTHPNLNPKGELLDRYGTPFRFHPESAWSMTVRSAGPDKRMWTSDDAVSQDLSQSLVQQ